MSFKNGSQGHRPRILQNRKRQIWKLHHQRQCAHTNLFRLEDRDGVSETYGTKRIFPVFDVANVDLENSQNKLSRALWTLAGDTEATQICGVPYTALPLAALISVEADIPMILRRKEQKPYGMKNMLEGLFEPGERCVLVEDVVVSGSSIMETTRDLEKSGLEVNLALVIIDRDQGAVKNLRDEGITLRSLFTMTSFLSILLEAGKISEQNFNDAVNYAKTYPVSLPSVVLRKLFFE